MGGKASKTLVADSSRAVLRNIPETSNKVSKINTTTISSIPTSSSSSSTVVNETVVASISSNLNSTSPSHVSTSTIPQYPSPMSTIKGPNPYAEDYKEPEGENQNQTDPNEKKYEYDNVNVLEPELLNKIKGWQPEVKTFTETNIPVFKSAAQIRQERDDQLRQSMGHLIDTNKGLRLKRENLYEGSGEEFSPPGMLCQKDLHDLFRIIRDYPKDEILDKKSLAKDFNLSEEQIELYTKQFRLAIIYKDESGEIYGV